MSDKTFQSYEDFWPFYLAQHSKRSTRAYHFAGTTLMFLCLLASFLYAVWFILLAPVVAYGLAWYSHFFVEGNKPATFGHPFWSLRADFRMYRLILLGRIDEELHRLNIPNQL
jgi:hypothetical protein